MKGPSKIALQMQRRRKALGMSYQLLAERSGVSLPTVQRILGDGAERASFANLEAIASALGMSFSLQDDCSEQEFMEQQTLDKAEAIVRMVQATSGLESQAVDADARRQMVQQTFHELMAGSRRRIWNPL